MNKIILFALIACASWSLTVRAEGGCPPGQYPQQGQGWQTCVPIPENNTVSPGATQPASRWADRWGALAADATNKIAGSSENKASKSEAIAAAIADCKAYGASGCRQSAAYRNQCIAVVSGNKLSRTYAADTEQQAADNGMTDCAADGQTGCHVFYSGCSLPMKIQ